MLKINIGFIIYGLSILTFPPAFLYASDYGNGSGLFDDLFTKDDITLVILISLAWLIRMYMERKNPSIKNPTVDDYFFSLIINYAFTGAIYQYVIYRNWPIGAVLFPLLMWAILSLDIVRYLGTKEGQDKLKTIFSGLLDFCLARIKKIFS